MPRYHVVRPRRKHKRPIRITEVKLGRHKAFGFAWTDGYIEIDPRLKPRSYLNTLIHEILHLICPNKSEWWIRKAACRITRAVWEANYRRVAR